MKQQAIKTEVFESASVISNKEIELPLSSLDPLKRVQRLQRADERREHDADQGGPLHVLVPKLYFWKSAKQLWGLKLKAKNQPGFWEMYGYHMHSDPRTEERFSSARLLINV